MGKRAYPSELSKKQPTNQIVSRCDQAGAICCRVSEAGKLEVLLITSRDTGRWVIPKGNIEPKEEPHRCAQREALEEAGVLGKVRRKPLGCYSYLKDNERQLVVSLHLLKLDRERTDFAEKGQRRKVWVSPHKAAALVHEPDLQAMFSVIDTINPLNSQDKPAPRKASKSDKVIGAHSASP